MISKVTERHCLSYAVFTATRRFILLSFSIAISNNIIARYMNPFIAYVTAYRIVISCNCLFADSTWKILHISSLYASLLKITTQQQKCTNLNIELLRLKFITINLTKNNKARVPTNFTKIGTIMSVFTVVAQSRE